MAKDPTATAARWAQRLGSSGDKIREGVQSVTTPPGQAAARQKQVWVARTTAAADKFAANSARVSLQDWQGAMLDKGLSRIASGATAAESKFAGFLTRFLPYVDQVRASLPPRGDLEANINRMTANARAMAKFSNSGR